MPVTSPDSVFYRNTATPAALETESATQASSIQTALNKRLVLTYRPANAAALTALTGMTEGDLARQTDTKITYRYNGSAWVAWESAPISLAPTIAGVTTSSSSQTYQYINSNILVSGEAVVSAAPSGAVTVATPVTVAAPSGSQSVQLGEAEFQDVGTTSYTGVIDQVAASLARLLVWNAASTYLAKNNLSSTVPFAWASGDRIKWRYWLTKDQL